MIGFTHQRAAIYGILSAYLVSLIRKESRLSIRKTIYVFEQGARVALPVIAAVATAGIIAGVVSMTGLGAKFAAGIIALSAGHRSEERRVGKECRALGCREGAEEAR